MDLCIKIPIFVLEAMRTPRAVGAALAVALQQQLKQALLAVDVVQLQPADNQTLVKCMAAAAAAVRRKAHIRFRFDSKWWVAWKLALSSRFPVSK